MPMPAVPAMPTSEYGVGGCTFSMSRLAIRLPMVARRSPAITTPSAYVIATMVVACGGDVGAQRPAAAAGGRAAARARPALRKSVKEDVPALVNASPVDARMDQNPLPRASLSGS